MTHQGPVLHSLEAQTFWRHSAFLKPCAGKLSGQIKAWRPVGGRRGLPETQRKSLYLGVRVSVQGTQVLTI